MITLTHQTTEPRWKTTLSCVLFVGTFLLRIHLWPRFAAESLSKFRHVFEWHIHSVLPGRVYTQGKITCCFACIIAAVDIGVGQEEQLVISKKCSEKRIQMSVHTILTISLRNPTARNSSRLSRMLLKPNCRTALQTFQVPELNRTESIRDSAFKKCDKSSNESDYREVTFEKFTQMLPFFSWLLIVACICLIVQHILHRRNFSRSYTTNKRADCKDSLKLLTASSVFVGIFSSLMSNVFFPLLYVF